MVKIEGYNTGSNNTTRRVMTEVAKVMDGLSDLQYKVRGGSIMFRNMYDELEASVEASGYKVRITGNKLRLVKK